MNKLIRNSILLEVITISSVIALYILVWFSGKQIIFEKPLYLLGYFMLLPMFFIFYKQCEWSENARKLLPTRYGQHDGNSKKTRTNFFLLWCFLRTTVVFLVIAVALPFFGFTKIKGQSPSQDIVIAVDLSNSMNTEDIAAKTSRLEVAKRVINEILTGLKGEKVGMTIFAGEAYLHLALTKDYESVRLFTADLTTEIMENQGTNIAGALYVSAQLFPEKSERQKRILIISDGEDHLGGVEAALDEVEDMQISVSFAAIGTEKGGQIPDRNGMPDDFYKKDINGQTIISKPNIEMIKSLATQAKEQAFWFSTAFPNTTELTNSLMSKSQRFTTENYTNKKDWYQLFTLLSLLSMLCYCLRYFKISILKPMRTVIIILVTIINFDGNCFAQTNSCSEHIQKAKELYRAGKYAESAKELGIANTLDPKKTKEYQGELAQALYKNGQYDLAKNLFVEQANNTKNQSIKSKASYNEGNALMNLKRYDEALEAYKNALRKNPNNEKAKYNYARANQKLKKQKPPPPKNDQKDEKDPKDRKNEDQSKNQDPKKDDKEKNNPNQVQKSETKQDKKLSDQKYQQLLDRINRQERETRKKMNANAKSANPIKNEKDW
jgi:von Willebrand factor type A domain/Tetratricopeptide repeat